MRTRSPARIAEYFGVAPFMRRLGPLAVPASICPAEPLNGTAPDHGYAPVVESLIARLETMLE